MHLRTVCSSIVIVVASVLSNFQSPALADSEPSMLSDDSSSPTLPTSQEFEIPENEPAVIPQTHSPLTVKGPAAWRQVTLRYRFEEHQAVVDSLVFGPESSRILAGGGENDPRLILWSLEDGDVLDSERAQQQAVNVMALSPNGSFLAVAGDTGNIAIWDVDNGELQRLLVDHLRNLLALSISPDSRVLVSGGLDGIRVWDLSKSRPLYTLSLLESPIYDLEIHPDGTLLISANQSGVVEYWDLRSGQKISDFKAHEQTVEKLAISPDGQTLITGSRDRLIRVWDIATQSLRFELKGHIGPIRGLALHPDGATLASASNDGVMIWDLATGLRIRHLKEHRDWVKSVSFSRNGQYLATGGFDRQVLIWEPGFGEPVISTQEAKP
ncbi:MAG: WD40 repeat domain-containing protein [Cyanobacteria bacterium P01_H01_bin.15]